MVREKKPVHKVQMTEEKRNIIQMLFHRHQNKAQGLGGKGTEGTLEGLIQSGIDGSEVTAWDMLALPAEEMISMEELEKRIREGKTEKWADPSYVLTAREKKEARQIIKEYYKEEYNRFAMDEEARKKAYQITMLENKTSIGAGIMTGILKAAPFHEKLIEGMDQLYRETEKLTGMEVGYTLSEAMQAVEAQYPAAAKASEITASVGYYALGAELVGSLPIAGKVAKTAGARAGALAGKLGAKAALQKGIEAGVTRIAADQIADTAVHTIPGIISDIGEGKEPQEIGINALKAEAGDLAMNVGSEAVLNIAQAAVKKVIGAIGGGSDVIGTVSKTNPFDLQPTHSPTLSKNKMNALMDDIKVNSIQEPIKYVEYNGQMYVVDGHHRLLAAKRLGLTEVPIEKVDLPYAGYNTIDDLLWFE